MSAPLSVVIPTLDVAARIGPTLGAIGEAVMAGLIREVILADGGSADAIAEIAAETGARLVEAPCGRGLQLAAGCREVRGDWLLVLHADSVPGPGWTRAARRHMALRPDRAGWFALTFDGGGAGAAMVAVWANLRARVFGLPYGDQGLLVPRALYEAVGGYAPIPLMEDVALVRAIGRRRLAPIPHPIVTSAERYLRDGWTRRGWRNLTTLGLWFAGVSPERLARRYGRS